MFPEAPDSLPAVTAEEMRALDRVLTQEVSLPLVCMMENLGRHLATLARELWPEARRITVLAGKGGNGGGGMAAARHLVNAGLDVSVALATPFEWLNDEPRTQASILRASGVPVIEGTPSDEAPDLVIDAVLGYNQRGAPRGGAAHLVQWALDAHAPVLSLDVPTGIDPDTGDITRPAIRADATLVFALPKAGVLTKGGREHAGRLFVADVGIPPAVYRRFGAPELPFGTSPIFTI